MNNDSSCSEKCRTLTVYSIGIFGSFLIMAVLVCTMVRYTQPPPISQDRATERAKNLKEVRNAEADGAKGYAWQDQGKGFIRLPVEQAVKIAEGEWKNPAAARANLIARVAKATEPPPKAPEVPSKFE